MFYTFNQNNSGGGFFIDPERGISVYVIVEADSAEEADTLAEGLGIYFDGVGDGRDCECCGDRWHKQWGGDGTETPEIYGKPASGPLDLIFKWAGEDPEGYIHYRSGEIKPVLA